MPSLMGVTQIACHAAEIFSPGLRPGAPLTPASRPGLPIRQRSFVTSQVNRRPVRRPYLAPVFGRGHLSPRPVGPGILCLNQIACHVPDPPMAGRRPYLAPQFIAASPPYPPKTTPLTKALRFSPHPISYLPTCVLGIRQWGSPKSPSLTPTIFSPSSHGRSG